MGILDLGRYKGIVFAITGFLVFIAIILAFNHGIAGQFADNVAGVKFLVQHQAQPAAVYESGRELTERLKSGEKIDEHLEVLRKAAHAYDHALSGLSSGGMISDSEGEVIAIPVLRSPEAQSQLNDAAKLWEGYKKKLTPVLNFAGSPYPAEVQSDSPAAAGAPTKAPMPGTQYSPRGRRLLAALEELN
jgi:two-component system, chemotaxis family, sensor kinase CheA